MEAQQSGSTSVRRDEDFARQTPIHAGAQLVSRVRVGAGDIVGGGLSRADLLAAGRDDERAVLALWTAKEAAAKALRSGFQGRPGDWRVSRATLDTDGNGSVDVAYGGQTVPVLVARVGPDAAMALAATAASAAEALQNAGAAR